jgi:UPF0755 protein
MRQAGIVIAGVVFLAAAGGAGIWWTLGPIDAPGGAPRTIVIPLGESTWQIGRRLASAGVVRAAWTVAVAAELRGVAGRLRHGEYALSPSQDALQIVDTLARGDVVQHRVTVPEGYTARQIADLLAASGLADRDRFLDVVEHGAGRLGRAAVEDLPLGSLEGYLFPDTYLFPRDLNEAAIVGRFLDRFDEAVGPEIRSAARARGMTLLQLVTVASMIEWEARMPEERPIIAGVIYNRLRRGMRLEIDATVLYALGRHKTALSAADLDVDSPYNTYRHDGLPPGPITNPGLASIIAAAHPADVPFLYYVLMPDGRHHYFSRTLREHLDAVRRYRR